MSRTDKDRPYKFRDNVPKYGRRSYWRYWYPVPKWFIDHVWNNPQRVSVRDSLNVAKSDYRANGDTDIEPINAQHRHGASWYYW